MPLRIDPPRVDADYCSSFHKYCFRPDCFQGETISKIAIFLQNQAHHFPPEAIKPIIFRQKPRIHAGDWRHAVLFVAAVSLGEVALASSPSTWAPPIRSTWPADVVLARPSRGRTARRRAVVMGHGGVDAC
jgi:hypothetical protein